MKRCTKTIEPIEKLPMPDAYTSIFDVAINEKGIVTMYIKINEIIERINDLPKRKGKK